MTEQTDEADDGVIDGSDAQVAGAVSLFGLLIGAMLMILMFGAVGGAAFAVVLADSAPASSYVAMLGEHGCIISDWHLVDTAVRIRNESNLLSFERNGETVRISGNFIHLANPTDADIAAIQAVGRCGQ